MITHKARLENSKDPPIVKLLLLPPKIKLTIS